jgi:hypothetical protein
VSITKTLAPPLKIYADATDVVLTTIDSMLVWSRRSKVNSNKMRVPICDCKFVATKIDSSENCIAR